MTNNGVITVNKDIAIKVKKLKVNFHFILVFYFILGDHE